VTSNGIIFKYEPDYFYNSGVAVASSRRNRWQIQNTADAVQFLSKKARNAFKACQFPHILIIGAPGTMTDTVREDLVLRGMVPVVLNLEDFLTNGVSGSEQYACVICTYTDICRTTAAARAVLADDRLSHLTFEYVTFPATSYAALEQHQTEGALAKVSPLPTYPIDVFDIYEASLEHFEKKCDIRDYMDVCQLLKTVKDNHIEGDVAEFGSYRGHSGYLMASVMTGLGLDKRLFLFDTFDSFPEEPLGIDRFWSGSHPVDFDTVRAKFDIFPFVTFVKGDFTRTLETPAVKKLALAYVDCDAYRSTDYLIRRIFPDILAPGGIIVFEDYGHAQLLGNRAAVHNYFDNRPGCVQFFSQFSGCYIVIKLSD
jgi:Macrocin-O-methyltransferase (TylF)